MSRYLTVNEDEAPLAFRLRMPEDEQAVPIVMLHGLGGDENVMWALESALPPDGLVVAPRGLHPQRQGGFAWNPIIKAWPPLLSEFSEAIDRLERLFDYLQSEYAMPLDRVVLMGFSNGTAMSFATAMTLSPQTPAGIIAISGHLPEGDLAPLRGIPVYWGHGSKDSFIPIDIALADAERLRASDVPVTFCEADVGHKLGAHCLKDLRSWFDLEFPLITTTHHRE